MSQENFKENIIIGAGIAGLSAAYNLHKKEDDFLLFEKDNRLGGTWQSLKYKDSIFEFGPNTIIDKSEALRELICFAGIEDEILTSDLKDSKRFFYRNNKLIEVSPSPLKMVFSKLLGLKAKFRILKEPFIKSKSNKDESVFDFFQRRFGKDFAQYIVAPALQGVWGGDIRQLNMSAALKTLYELEQRHSSIIRGFLFSKKDKKKSERLRTISFKNGLEDLCTKIGAAIGQAKIKINSELLSIEKEDDFYKLQIKRGKNLEYYHCKNLILACPATISGKLLAELSPKLSTALQNIYYAPISLVAYSIPKSLVKGKEYIFDAFGFLNSTNAHFTLGTIFASSLFKERNIEDEHLFISFIGGSKNAQIIDFEESDLNAIALNEAKEIFDNALDTNINLEDINFIDSKFIKQAIPQYNDNYLKAKTIIDSELAKTPNLELLGNYMNGVSIVDTIEDSQKISKI